MNDPPFAKLLACSILAIAWRPAFGAKLPLCPSFEIVLTQDDIGDCRQEVKLLGSQDCRGPLASRCCLRLNKFLARNCHCWSGFAANHRYRLEELIARCNRVEPVVKLFVGVLTTGKNRLARQAIRDTWGADPRLHRVLFFSAKPVDNRVFDSLRREAAAKSDIVILPTVWESYFNITHQTLEVLRASALDTGATHTLKADDDSYVRVGEVLSRIEQAPQHKMFMGFIENPGGGPHRNPSSQWYVTVEEWPSERYPPWAHGAGYVLSQDLVQEIAAGAALKAQDHQMFKLEDIAVGSWVEWVGKDRMWDIHYVADQAFNYNGCNGQDAVSHYIKPRGMRCMFKNGGACCKASSLSQPHLRGGSNSEE